MTTTHYDKISARIAELKLALPTTTTPTPRGTRSTLASDERGNLNRHINQLQAAIKGKWVASGLCFTHGHGVYEGHDSGHCNFEGKGHVKTATRNNPEVQGKEKNKGKDDFLL